MGELAVHLPGLRHLSLCFNNAAQQLGTRHLAAIVRLPALRTLTIQASFQAEDCDFSVLAGAGPPPPHSQRSARGPAGRLRRCAGACSAQTVSAVVPRPALTTHPPHPSRPQACRA
jgi:hypothetical protein